MRVNATCVQVFSKGRLHAAGAHSIEQNLDPYARLGPLGERRREPAADFALPVDVGLDGDRALRARDFAQHHRVEFVAVVQQFDSIAVRQLDADCPGDGRQELGRIHTEFVIEAVSRWRFDRRNQVAECGHRAGAERPAPLTLGDREQAHEEPRPPRPQQLPRARPERGEALRSTFQRIDRERPARACMKRRAAPAERSAPRPWNARQRVLPGREAFGIMTVCVVAV